LIRNVRRKIRSGGKILAAGVHTARVTARVIARVSKNNDAIVDRIDGAIGQKMSGFS